MEYFLRRVFGADCFLVKGCSWCRMDFVGECEGDLTGLLDEDFLGDCRG